MKRIICTLLAVSLAACETVPVPTQGIPLTYRSASCADLHAEYDRVKAVHAERTKQFLAADLATGVAIGVAALVFWPALFLAAGSSGQATAMQQSRTEMDQIAQAAEGKQCAIAGHEPQQQVVPVAPDFSKGN